MAPRAAMVAVAMATALVVLMVLVAAKMLNFC
jgi:hypothetical protein